MFARLPYKHDANLEILPLARLNGQYTTISPLNQLQQEGLASIEQAYENRRETLNRINEHLLCQGALKEMNVDFVDNWECI